MNHFSCFGVVCSDQLWHIVSGLSPPYETSLVISASTTSTNGKHGSFKSAFSGSSQPCKNGFRVSFRNPSDGQSHTLFAPDEHSKKQWISALKKVSPQEDITTNDDSKTNVPTETGMLLFKDVYLKTEL